MSVRIEFATINDEQNNEAAGIILCFDTLEEAEVPFRALIKSYEETNIYEKTTVHFVHETESTYSMHFTIHGNDSFKAVFMGIAPKRLQMLIESIETQGFIFILSAIIAKNSEIILNRNKYICLTRVYLDEQIYESHIDELKYNFKAIKEAIK